MKKKLVGLLLCLSMVLAIGLLPTAVRAGEPTELTASSFEDGGAYSGYTLTGGDSESAPAAYKLGGDIELSKTLVITGYVSLDLNGHGLTLSADATTGSVIQIGTSDSEGNSIKGYLTLKDEATDKKTTYWKANADGLWEKQTTEGEGVQSVTGGTITGGKGTNVAAGGGITYTEGGGVYIKKGSLTMTGGTIVGNTAEYGGGVDGTFTMSGGTIVGNTASTNGGGVYLGSSSTFTMSGTALISGNTAKNGGGVAANWDGTININGGTISGNTATGGNGGGVSLYNSSTTLTMTGGTITGNTATASGGNGGNGGGVRVAGGTFNMSGGTIGGETAADGNTAKNGGGVYVEKYGTTGGKFTMSGSASVKNNAASTNGGGVYVESGSVILSGGAQINSNWKGGTKAAGATAYTDGTANNVYLTDGNKISVSGGLTGGKKCIGVSTATAPAAGAPVMVVIPVSNYTLTESDRKAFFPDDSSSYHIEEGTYTTSTGDVTCFNLCPGEGHDHEWTYSHSETSNATIVATCTGDGTCPLNNSGGSVTISAPDAASLTYDGNPKPATVSATADWVGTAATDIVITYYKVNISGRYEQMSDVPTDAGTYKAEFTANGARGYIEYTIAKATPTAADFTYTDLEEYYDGEAKTAKVTTDKVGMGEITVKYYGADGDAVSAENVKNAGSYTVKISVAEGTNYNATTTDLEIGTLTIKKGNHPNEGMDYCNVSFTVSVSSNIDKSFQIALPTPPEGMSYGEVELNHQRTAKDKDGQAQTSSLFASGGDHGKLDKANNQLTLHVSCGTQHDGWHQAVAVSITDDNNNYENFNVIVTVTVQAKAQKGLDVTMYDWTYGNTANTPSYTENSGMIGTATVEYKGKTEADSAYTTDVPTNAGNYTVRVSYETATEIYTGTDNFTIKKKEIWVSVLSESSKTYDGTAAVPDTAELTFGGLIGTESLTSRTDYTFTASYDKADVSATKINITVTLLNTATANNYVMQYVGQGEQGQEMVGTIDPRPITVAVTVDDKTYDGTDTATVSGVTFTGLVGTETLTNTDYTVEAEFADANAGDGKTVSYTVALKDSAAAKNYVFSTGTGMETTKTVTGTKTATIEQKEVSITWGSGDLTYTGSAQAPAVTVTGAVNNDSVTATVTGAQTNAGTGYTATVTGLSSNNYELPATGLTKDFSIAKATLTNVSAAQTGVLTYNGKAQHATAVFEATTVGENRVTFTYSATNGGTYGTMPAFTNAGTYKVYYKASAANHEDAFGNFDVTIGKASLTVTASDVTATYGDTDKSVSASGTGSVTYAVTSGADVVSVDSSTGALTILKAGSATVTATAAGDDNHDSGTATINVTVAPKTLIETMVGTPDNKTYTGNALMPAVPVQDGDKSLGANTDYTLEYSGNVTVGTATVTVQGIGNYTGTLERSFTIAAASLTGVSAEQSGTLTYTGSAQTATVTAAATTVDSSAVSFTYSAEQDGTYSAAVPAFTSGTHTVYYKASADNHETASGSFTVTVGKATVTVTAADKSAYTGSTAPDLSSPVEGTDYTLSGLIGTDTLSSAVSLTCDADMSKAGSYDIVPSVTDEDERYAFVFVNGTLTVSNRPVSSRPAHKVDVKDALNGSVTANQTEAREGTVVTVTVDPAIGYALDELTVVDKNGNAIAVTSLGGGKYTFIMPDSDVVVRTTFTDGTSTGFVDVPVNKYFYDAVNWAVANGITSGVDAAHFAPYASCTRGQLVTFLWRAAGQPAAKATENAFGDVKETSSFYKAILWAAENGIVGGYDDGTFHPGNAISRQQTAAILYRYAKYAKMDVSVGEDTNILSFNDATSVSEYAVAAFQWATGAQVITGNGANLLPYDTCTRAQIVTMLYRLLAK